MQAAKNVMQEFTWTEFPEEHFLNYFVDQSIQYLLE